MQEQQARASGDGKEIGKVSFVLLYYDVVYKQREIHTCLYEVYTFDANKLFNHLEGF